MLILHSIYPSNVREITQNSFAVGIHCVRRSAFSANNAISKCGSA